MRVAFPVPRRCIYFTDTTNMLLFPDYWLDAMRFQQLDDLRQTTAW